MDQTANSILSPLSPKDPRIQPDANLVKARRRIQPDPGLSPGDRLRSIDHQRSPGDGLLTPERAMGTVCCSPGDEPILTTTGWVAIKDLDPARDKLAGHHRRVNKMTWGGTNNPATDGFIFKMSASPYRGNLVVLVTDRGRTRLTPNHRVLVRLNDAFPEKWCVYLMRKGKWWRIGECVTAHRPYRSAGVAGRLATEQGDAGWILGVHDTRKEALIAEATWQGRFGMPGLSFRTTKDRSLSNRNLAGIHQATAARLQKRLNRVFSETGLWRETPLYTRGVFDSREPKKRLLRGIFATAAGNLLPLSGYVDIAVPKEPFVHRNHKPEYRQPDLMRASITTEPFEGTVYGLDVPPFHHYVSGGAVVQDSDQWESKPRLVQLVLDLVDARHGEH